LFAGSAIAQTRDTAAVFGTITDSQGALIPGATVTLTSAGTQQVRSAKTSESGGYLFSLLPVGAYSITVEQAGFRKYERKGVVLQANENVNVSLSLEVGDVQSTVFVDAQASQVETRVATVKETVDERKVVELPLNGAMPRICRFCQRVSLQELVITRVTLTLPTRIALVGKSN